jgi:hypothetical protein
VAHTRRIVALHETPVILAGHSFAGTTACVVVGGPAVFGVAARAGSTIDMRTIATVAPAAPNYLHEPHSTYTESHQSPPIAMRDAYNYWVLAGEFAEGSGAPTRRIQGGRTLLTALRNEPSLKQRANTRRRYDRPSDWPAPLHGAHPTEQSVR